MSRVLLGRGTILAFLVVLTILCLPRFAVLILLLRGTRLLRSMVRQRLTRELEYGEHCRQLVTTHACQQEHCMAKAAVGEGLADHHVI